MVNLRDSNGRSLYFSNRKEYYRRKKISQSLIKRRSIQTIKTRIRRQVVYNDSYRQSIRAIAINSSRTERELENLLISFLESNPRLLNFGFDRDLTIGFETEQIDSEEDKKFVDGVTYIEIKLHLINKVEIIRVD